MIGETERCWTPLQYTKPWLSFKTPALTDTDGNLAISLEDKKTMVRKAAFPLPPSYSDTTP